MGLAGYFLQAHFWGNQGEPDYLPFNHRARSRKRPIEFTYAGGQNEGCAR